MNQAVNHCKPALFSERHRFLCFVISFCLGLAACVVNSNSENKQSVQGQVNLPAALDTAGPTIDSDDCFEPRQFQSGDLPLIGDRAVHGQGKPDTKSITGDVELPNGYSLTNLKIRLQI